LTLTVQKPRDDKAEAGWRRGYAADCKAAQNPAESNALEPEARTDRTRTNGQHDTPALVPQKLSDEKETPGALAGATGGGGEKELRRESYAEKGPGAISRFAKDRHKRAAGMVLAALTLGDDSPEVWHDAAFVLRVKLTPVERIGLAFAALRALDPDPRERVFEAAHWGEVTGAGAPLPPLFDVMEDARWWASNASRRERKAYCLAAFEAMPAADQSAFLVHVQRRAAA
jgi:hypothetical protein